jgi:hypothetical protein
VGSQRLTPELWHGHIVELYLHSPTSSWCGAEREDLSFFTFILNSDIQFCLIYNIDSRAQYR